ncbi:MAG TPA: hypothetical protein PLN91_00550 [Rhodanobacteraceae bacterium]|nr:hypothetical protein [Rhodanobacteraceae bacterium]
MAADDVLAPHDYAEPLGGSEPGAVSLPAVRVLRDPAHPSLEQYPALQRAVDHFNASLFNSELRPCLVTLNRRRRIRGYYVAEAFINRDTGESTDEIGLHPGYFTGRSLEEILSVLVSKQVLQWCRQNGEESPNGYYSRRWAKKMIEIGLQPSKTGAPGGEEVGWGIEHYILAGGPYLKACRELLKSDFSVPWMDRFLMPEDEGHGATAAGPHADPALIGAGAEPTPGDPIAAADAMSPASTLSAEAPAEKSVAAPLPSSTLGKPEIFTPERASEADLSAIGVVVDAPKRASRNSNKTAYECPQEHIKVWGKPGIAVVCGVCMEPLVSNAPAPEEPQAESHDGSASH